MTKLKKQTEPKENPMMVRVFYDLKEDGGLCHEDVLLESASAAEIRLRWAYGFKFYICMDYFEGTNNADGKVCVRFENDMGIPPDVPTVIQDKELEITDAGSLFNYSIDISDELEAVAGLWRNYRRLKAEHKQAAEAHQAIEDYSKQKTEKVAT